MLGDMPSGTLSSTSQNLAAFTKLCWARGPPFTHTHTTSHQQHFHVKLECASGPSPTLTHEQHTALTAPLAQHLHAFLEAWHQREATWRSQRPQRCFAERCAEILSELLQVCLSVRPHGHPMKRTGFRGALPLQSGPLWAGHRPATGPIKGRSVYRHSAPRSQVPLTGYSLRRSDPPNISWMFF